MLHTVTTVLWMVYDSDCGWFRACDVQESTGAYSDMQESTGTYSDVRKVRGRRVMCMKVRGRTVMCRDI